MNNSKSESDCIEMNFSENDAEQLARAFLEDIIAFFASEEGKREFAESRNPAEIETKTQTQEAA